MDFQLGTIFQFASLLTAKRQRAFSPLPSVGFLSFPEAINEHLLLCFSQLRVNLLRDVDAFICTLRENCERASRSL